MKKFFYTPQVWWGISIIAITLNLALFFALYLVRLTTLDALTTAEVALTDLAQIPVVVDVAMPVESSPGLTATIKLNLTQTPLQTDLQQTHKRLVDLIKRLNPAYQSNPGPETNPSSPTVIGLSGDAAALRPDVTTPPSGNESNTTSSPPINAQSAMIVDGTGPTADVSQAITQGLPDINLGACNHEYWPLRPGMRWAYRSNQTSYQHQVDDLGNNQIFLSTEYEGQRLHYDIVCYQEGLGGNFLGDVRHLSEFAGLVIGNPRGVFLPRSDVLTQIGYSWQQTFDITGQVAGRYQNQAIMGQVREGGAEAAYLVTNIELIDTPIGPQEAIRIQQELKLNLDIDYLIDGQEVRGNQSVKLQTIFWFVKGLGLVKNHWQGGPIWHVAKVDDLSEKQQIPVPPLAEESLISICLNPVEGQPDCLFTVGYSDRDWAPPPLAELVVGSVTLPTFVETLVAQAEPNLPDDSVFLNSDDDHNSSNDSSDDQSNDSDSSQADNLVDYLQAIAELEAQISGPGQDFYESAIAYRLDNIALEEFADVFQTFGREIKGPIATFRTLSPPAEAQGLHQQLSDGLDKCTSAMDALDSWLDNQDDDLKDQGMDDAQDCLSILQEAQDERIRLSNSS